MEKMSDTTPDAQQPADSVWLVQVDFPSDGPFGEDMAKAYSDLAHSIAGEPGLIWKLWTEDSEAQEAGGIYLFDTREEARAYLDMHSARLTAWGVTGIRARIFQVNRALSQITRGLPPD